MLVVVAHACVQTRNWSIADDVSRGRPTCCRHSSTPTFCFGHILIRLRCLCIRSQSFSSFFFVDAWGTSKRLPTEARNILPVGSRIWRHATLVKFKLFLRWQSLEIVYSGQSQYLSGEDWKSSVGELKTKPLITSRKAPCFWVNSAKIRSAILRPSSTSWQIESTACWRGCDSGSFFYAC